MSGLLDSAFQVERKSFYQNNEIIPEDMWRKRLVRLGYSPEEITMIYNSGYYDIDEKMYNFVPDKHKKYELDLHTTVRFMAFDDNVVIGFSKISSKQTILYTVNKGKDWLEATPDTTIVIEKAGDVVGFRGKFNGEIEDVTDTTTFSCIEGNVGVDGNLNAMFDWENVDEVELTPFCAAQLFEGCNGIKYVYNLEMPASILSDYCYKEMFAGCSQITESPVLPAVELANGCYDMMFMNCAALEVTPELPAEVMSEECYMNMFYDCVSLVEAPVLNSVVLADSCYDGMFYGCTALTNAPELPAETLATHCYNSMFMNCTSLEVAPVLDAEIMVDGCYGSMFAGCIALTEAPELHATVLVDSCYSHMFYGCSNLARIECLATDISASGCTENWVEGVASEGVFDKAPEMEDWTVGVNGIPEGWTKMSGALKFVAKADNSVLGLTCISSNQQLWYTVDNGNNWIELTPEVSVEANNNDVIYVRGILSGDNSDSDYTNFSMEGGFVVSGNINTLFNYTNLNAELYDYCGYGLFSDCTVLEDASWVELPSMNLSDYCYASMFENTGIDYAPELPATVLSEGCYHAMFMNCSSLTTAPVLNAETLTEYCYKDMFNGCSSLAYINCKATDINASGCTENWVSGVSANGTFHVNNAQVEWSMGVNGIPEGWSITGIELKFTAKQANSTV